MPVRSERNLDYISNMIWCWRLFFCLCPAAYVVCPNNKSVVFQPQTGTAPDLGFVANYTFYYNPPAPPFSTGFLGLFIFPLYPTVPPIISICCRSLSLLQPLPTSSPSTKRRPPGRCLHPPATSLRCSSLRPAPHVCICRRVLWLCAPPLFRPQPAPRLMSDPGRFSCCGYLFSCVPPPHPPWVIRRLPSYFCVYFSVGWIFARGWWARAPPLTISLLPWFSLPPILGLYLAFHYTPPSLPPYVSPPCNIDPIPVSVGVF